MSAGYPSSRMGRASRAEKFLERRRTKMFLAESSPEHRSEFVNVMHVQKPPTGGFCRGSNHVLFPVYENLRFLEKRLENMNILAVPTTVPALDEARMRVNTLSI